MKSFVLCSADSVSVLFSKLPKVDCFYDFSHPFCVSLVFVQKLCTEVWGWDKNLRWIKDDWLQVSTQTSFMWGVLYYCCRFFVVKTVPFCNCF